MTLLLKPTNKHIDVYRYAIYVHIIERNYKEFINAPQVFHE